MLQAAWGACSSRQPDTDSEADDRRIGVCVCWSGGRGRGRDASSSNDMRSVCVCASARACVEVYVFILACWCRWMSGWISGEPIIVNLQTRAPSYPVFHPYLFHRRQERDRILNRGLIIWGQTHDVAERWL